MSRINGDKARYNRDRKARIARRKRNHERLKEHFSGKGGSKAGKPKKVE